jgi:hypothetical protein
VQHRGDGAARDTDVGRQQLHSSRQVERGDDHERRHQRRRHVERRGDGRDRSDARSRRERGPDGERGSRARIAGDCRRARKAPAHAADCGERAAQRERNDEHPHPADGHPDRSQRHPAGDRDEREDAAGCQGPAVAADRAREQNDAQRVSGPSRQERVRERAHAVARARLGEADPPTAGGHACAPRAGRRRGRRREPQRGCEQKR